MELKDAIAEMRRNEGAWGPATYRQALRIVLDHVESTMPKKGPMTATELDQLRTVPIPVLKDDIARIRDIGRCYVPKVREQIERVAKAAESTEVAAQQKSAKNEGVKMLVEFMNDWRNEPHLRVQAAAVLCGTEHLLK